MSSELKRIGAIQLVIRAQFKNLHLWWCGGAIVPVELINLHIGKALSRVKAGFKTTYSLNQTTLVQGMPCIFHQDKAKLDTASIIIAWFHRRVQVQDWPACSLDHS